MSNKGRNRVHAACIHLCAFGRGLSLVIFLLSQQCAAQCAIGVHLLICIPQALQTSIECGIYFISKYFRIHKPRNLHNVSQEWNDQNAFRNILYTTVILNEHVHRHSEKALQVFCRREPIVNPILGSHQLFKFNLTHLLPLKLRFPTGNFIEWNIQPRLKFTVYQRWQFIKRVLLNGNKPCIRADAFGALIY